MRHKSEISPPFNLTFFTYRSTNLDSWSPDQLKTMCFGGNNRAQVFFKQHGWTDGGKIEAKYTSRAADLYRQILSKEVAKSMAEEVGTPSSPVASQSVQASNGLANIKTSEAPKENSLGRQEAPEISASPKASNTVITSSVKKPLGARKTGKTGGLGARKLTTKVRFISFNTVDKLSIGRIILRQCFIQRDYLTMQPNESLYDQKPEEPVVPVATANNSTPAAGSSFASRFEYVENVQSAETNSGGPHVISHVCPPKSSSFFADFGMDSGFQRKAGSHSSKVQVSPLTHAYS